MTINLHDVNGVAIQPRHPASCHCGGVRFELDLPDGLVDVRRCDCSFCRRRGAIVASVPLSGIHIVEGEALLTLYQFNTRTAHHYFCSRCGVYTHHQRRSNPSQYGFNVACLEGIDPLTIPDVPTYDGVNHPADRISTPDTARPASTVPDETLSAGLTAVGQLAVAVSDVGSALAFYRDVLGLAFLFAPSDTLAFLQCGETRLMLTTPQGAGEVGHNSIAYFRTADIESLFATVKARGAKVEREPQCTARLPEHELWIGFLRDPDNNLVGIMEERASG